jgi:hypothetical protein
MGLAAFPLAPIKSATSVACARNVDLFSGVRKTFRDPLTASFADRLASYLAGEIPIGPSRVAMGALNSLKQRENLANAFPDLFQQSVVVWEETTRT